MKRRELLTLSLGSMGVVLLSQCARGQTKDLQSSPSSFPQEYTSKSGLLELNLEANYNQIKVANRPAYLMNYNGQVPGPKLEAKPGDTVRIHFTNNLPQHSNLHYHGLHIPPTGKADNAFLDIAPKETFTYEFTIPKNHPSGIYWYHPHTHHVSAEQVFNGLAGLLVIRGEFDKIPEVKAAKENFLVLQDFDLDNSGRILPPNPMTQMMGREGNLMTINGQSQPNFSIASGGLLRLRILNASASRFYRLALEDHPLYLIATDGHSLAEPVELQELLITPGERAEILIKGDRKSGQYRLLNLPYNRGGMGMMGGGMMNHESMGRMNHESMGRMNHESMGGMDHNMMGNSENSNTPQPLASLVYQGSTSPLTLPQKLIPIQALPKPEKVRRIELSMEMQPGEGMVFLFNNKTYDHQRIDTQVQLNTIEDWELVNIDPDKMEHPFHLHINPFQVISRNGKPEPYLAWKDTVLVKGGETVRIRTQFKDFTGKSVYHCHILDHEDLGMMGIIEIKS